MAKQTLTPNRPVRTATTTRQQPGRPAAGRAAASSTRKAQPSVIRPFQMPFEKKNIMGILLGIGVIALGYLIMYMSPTMSTGALTIAPIVLLLGYCVVVPLGIMAGSKSFKKATTSPTPETPATNGAA